MDNKMMIAAAVVVIVVIAGAAAFFMMNQNSDSDGEGKLVGKVLKEAEYPADASRLWVYGNANEDDKINEDDITYLKAVVAGTKKATVLSDANADGKVDQQDVDRVTELVRANANTKLAVYYVDNYHTVSAVHWPVTSIAIGFSAGGYLADLTGLVDKVKMVDWCLSATDWKHINSKYATLPSFGEEEEPNLEAVLEQKIDVFVPGYCVTTVDDKSRTFFKGTSTDCMFINTCDKDGGGDDTAQKDIDRSIVMFAYLLQGDMDQTYEYLEWHDEVIGEIEDAVKSLADKDKVRYIMFRTAPSYVTTGQYTIAGNGNTCIYHSEIAGATCAGLDSELSDTYQDLDEDAIYSIVEKYSQDGTFVIIDNENDGIRGQRPLTETVPSIMNMMSKSKIDITYCGFARELCNSGLYLAETAFYLNVFYPELSGDIDYLEIFDYYLENFVSEDLSEYIYLDHFFYIE